MEEDNMEKICYHCHGRGKVPCSHCNGSGDGIRIGIEYIPIFGFPLTMPSTCTECGGSGMEICKVCNGTGKIQE